MEKEEKENPPSENEATKGMQPTTTAKQAGIAAVTAAQTEMPTATTTTRATTTSASSKANDAPTATIRKDNQGDNSNTSSTKPSTQQLAAAAEHVAVALAIAKELPSQEALNEIIRAHLEQRSPVPLLTTTAHALNEPVTTNGHVAGASLQDVNKSANNKSVDANENDAKKLKDDSGHDGEKLVEQNEGGGNGVNGGLVDNNNADVAEQGNEPTPTASIRSIGSFVCRICHNAENPERLVSPCLCKGSLTYVHIHCLERWISTSRNTTCELCQFQYNTEQTLRYTCLQSLRMWYSRSMSRRALQEDCQMFSLLTLVAFGIIGTLLVGIQYYFLQGRTWGLGRLWTKGWLVFFLFTTVVVYFINIYMIVRSQLSPWYRWWQSARDIKLILENRKPFQFRPSRRLQNRQMTETTSSSAMTVYPAPPPSPATAHPEQQQQHPSCAFTSTTATTAAAQLPPNGIAPQAPQYPLHLQFNRNAVVAAALAEFDDYGNRCNNNNSNNIPYNYCSNSLNYNANNYYNNSNSIYSTSNSILCHTSYSSNSNNIYHNNNICTNNSNSNHSNNTRSSNSNNKYVVVAGLPLAVLGNPLELADAAATAAVSSVATAVEIPLDAVIYETAL